jgi:hypothetical protein
MSTDAVPALFRCLVDDAALFPPGNAPMPAAVAEHRHHRSVPYADLVGPLLVPVARWEEFQGHLVAGERFDTGLIGGADLDQLIDVARRAASDPRVELVQIECPAGESATGTARRIRAGLGDVAPDLFIEIPRTGGWLDAVAALAALPVRAWSKLRTGGPRADAFPTEAQLAGFIETCRRLEHPFKLTAGLHRAVRNTDPRTGFEHHGYLNVLAAESGPTGTTGMTGTTGIEATLAVRDPRPLVAALPGSRTWFRSYGSCSVAEPLTDLAALGLLDPALVGHLPADREHREEHA